MNTDDPPPRPLPTDLLAFDCETSLIAPGVASPALACVTWARVAEDGISIESGIWDAFQGPRELAAALERGATLAGFNVAFDVGVCCEEYAPLWPLFKRAYDEGRVLDAKIREELIDIALGTYRRFKELDEDTGEEKWTKAGYSLAEVAHRRLGIQMTGKKRGAADTEDPWRLRYVELLGTPVELWPEAARTYAVKDAEITLNLVTHQHQQWDAIETEAVQTRAAWALHAIESRGLLVDMEALGTWAEALRVKVRECRALLDGTGIYRSDGTRDMAALRALIEAAYTRQGMSPPTTPTTGDVSTSYTTLIEADDPVLDAAAKVKSYEKLLTAFVPALAKGTQGALQSRYSPLVATGRTSCSGPNVQQMPKVTGARECIVPRRGFWFASVDYSSVELRTLGQAALDILGKSTLAELYQNDPDADPHSMLAATLLGITADEGLALKKAKDKGFKLARQRAKACNFGFPGGLGIKKFRAYAKDNYELELTDEEARALRDAWKATWPEVDPYQKWVNSQLDPATSEGTFVLTQPPEGSFTKGRSGYTHSCNFMFQGLAALGAKMALWRVVTEGPEHECFAVAFIHDEILAEVPAEPARATAASTWLAKVMCEEMQKVCPNVPITAEPALMDRWRKSAEPVFNPEGQLIPWMPEEKKE